jgi:four helix bundle protein
MQSFLDLKVWRKSHEVALAVYRATGAFPETERYGVTNQMRRAAASVAANIAEGCGRGSDADFARFLHLPMGSASELEYFLLLARDLDYLAETERAAIARDLEEVKRMLAGLIARLRS